MTIELFQTGLLQGLILALVALGIMIPFRMLNFPDLSAEGAYPLGGAVSASLMLAGFNQVTAVFSGMLASALLALATAQIAIRLKIDSLLAGIILSIMAYSINLRVMGQPNLALFNLNYHVPDFAAVMLILLICSLPFLLFLSSDYGLRFRAVGINPQFAARQGISVRRYTSLGLFLAGALYGLAGCMMVQVQQFVDVGMGTGIVIHGLASLMLGEAILGRQTLLRQLLAPVLGALIYQQLQGAALSLGLMPMDLKFFTGSIVLIILTLQRRRALC